MRSLIPESSNSTLRELQSEVVSWANGLMPDRTPEEAFRKLMEEEIEEMKKAPTDAMEYADAVIILLDLAYLLGIDIVEAVRSKMEINRNRKWKIENGLFKHVKGGAE